MCASDRRTPHDVAVIVLADPLTQTWELPVSPLFLSAAAVCLLGAVTWLAAQTARAPVEDDAGTRGTQAPEDAEPREGPLFWVGRAIGLALLLLAIVAGRFGSEAELSNVTPALVMGAGWPMLVVATALFGAAWHWLNPFDTLGRAVAPLGAGDGTDAQANAAWALPAALLWVAYLTMWPSHLAPRSISNALLIYTVATLAGVLAFGRRTWLSGGEIFSVFFGLVAKVRRHGTAAQLPEGAHLVLGVLCGGFVYGLLRDSQLLLDIGYGPRSTLYSALALAAAVAVTVGLTVLAYRSAQRRGCGTAVLVGLIPAATGLAVALGLARNRLTTSLQLLPVVSSDPLGQGLDLFGTRDWVLNGRPLGIAGLLALQIAVVLLGCLAGAIMATRRARTAGSRVSAGPVSVPVVLLAVAVAAIGATAVTT